ncbi:radical SAM family heme chaperone HemW [uncultured Megasphaera sp.]|uniref:radical SAM family heme chaperone HemW n=1 Tax=uncultured Megasphaera sp. TaxID=165188 RepID=UPI00265A188E|nr:radical SAM family heme chaperone HemW [uncultured Megasphaera sp.]
MIGVYVHIPFCAHKCIYCDFPSYSGAGQYADAYVDALCREIACYDGDSQADTVYFGGGTPSLLSAAQFARIFTQLQQTFSLAADAEITVEANPDSLTASWVRELAQIGVNRVSLGIQSFDDGVLRTLGRLHTAAEGRQAVQTVWEQGIENISIDLMYGLPGQTVPIMQRTLAEAAELPVCHASVYRLIVEEHTPLQAAVCRQRLHLPSDEETDAMEQAVHAAMKERGFHHYEVSAYAGAGKESRHNCKYWQYEPYAGFGVSAHSFDGQCRRANMANIPQYIRRAGRQSVTGEEVVIDRKRAVEDYCFLALRMRRGIDSQDFCRRFSCSLEDEFGPVLQQLLSQHLLERSPQGYRLTATGLAYGNYVFSRFIR